MTWSLPAKRGHEVLDYAVDWTARLASGEALASMELSVLTGDVVVGATAIEGAKTKFRLTGGTTATQIQQLQLKVITTASPPQTMEIQLSLTLVG